MDTVNTNYGGSPRHAFKHVNPGETVAVSSLKGLADFYREHLFNAILPFWTRHANDHDGGINTCILDDGRVTSRDKWLWSQWRAVWVFSHLYNAFGRDRKWLESARHVYDFAVRHGWDPQAKAWRLCVGHDGTVVRGCESLYVDAFAIYGLTEFAAATGEHEALMHAGRTADALLDRLSLAHDQIPHFPYPVPKGARVHGIPMMLSLVFHELARLLKHPRYDDAAGNLGREVWTSFYRPDRDAVLERISNDGGAYPAPAGTAVVPGHVIESMWFQIHMARAREDQQTVIRACRLIRRHLELGWDAKYGGLFLAIDIDGGSEVGWDHADTKLWWPQTEALYATLLAHEMTGEPWCLEWHERIHDYCFSHFPVRENGEWTQKLDRKGAPISDVVALPVKDPFHLPRALMYCIECLDRMART